MPLDKLLTIVKNVVMYAQFVNLLRSPVFISCLVSWFAAQTIKTLIGLFIRQIHNAKEFFEFLIWKTGGMPSSHTALVVSVCTSIGIRSGIDSDIFILSFCFGMVTIRDALGVRRSTGLQAKKINEIAEHINKSEEIISEELINKKKIENSSSDPNDINIKMELWERKVIQTVKEVMGHKPTEVLMGAILGFVIGLTFSLI